MFIDYVMSHLKQDSLKMNSDSFFARLTDLPMSESEAKTVGAGLAHMYGSDYEVRIEFSFHG